MAEDKEEEVITESAGVPLGVALSDPKVIHDAEVLMAMMAQMCLENECQTIVSFRATVQLVCISALDMGMPGEILQSIVGQSYNNLIQDFEKAKNSSEADAPTVETGEGD